jgi:hypothetical protein
VTLADGLAHALIVAGLGPWLEEAMLPELRTRYGMPELKLALHHLGGEPFVTHLGLYLRRFGRDRVVVEYVIESAVLTTPRGFRDFVKKLDHDCSRSTLRR